MEDKGFVLTGKVLDKDSSLPLKNALTAITYVDSVASIKYCYTDSNGVFYFILNKKYDNNKNNENRIFSFKKRHGAFMDHSFQFLHQLASVWLLFNIKIDKPGDNQT